MTTNCTMEAREKKGKLMCPISVCLCLVVVVVVVYKVEENERKGGGGKAEIRDQVRVITIEEN